MVLASCSDYFRAMFTEPMKERGQADIHLYGVSPVGLGIILNYIYTSKLLLSLANIQPVLSAASQLQMIKVRSLLLDNVFGNMHSHNGIILFIYVYMYSFFQIVNVCSSYLEDQLDLENCVDVMTLAETFSLIRLRRIVYRFVSQNISKICTSNSHVIQRLTANQMHHLLASEFPVDVPEIKVLDFVLSWSFQSGSNVDHNNRLNDDDYRLLKQIKWAQISVDELQNYVFMQDNHIGDGVGRKYLLSELMLIQAQHHDTEEDKQIHQQMNAVLINSRGLESALIAVIKRFNTLNTLDIEAAIIS